MSTVTTPDTAPTQLSQFVESGKWTCSGHNFGYGTCSSINFENYVNAKKEGKQYTYTDSETQRVVTEKEVLAALKRTNKDPPVSEGVGISDKELFYIGGLAAGGLAFLYTSEPNLRAGAIVLSLYCLEKLLFKCNCDKAAH